MSELARRCEEAEGLLALLPPHKCSLSITHNQHLDYYQTVAELIADEDGYYNAGDFPPGERDKCISTNEIWTLHWYPNTPIGFNLLHASSFETLIAALRAGGENG